MDLVFYMLDIILKYIPIGLILIGCGKCDKTPTNGLNGSNGVAGYSLVFSTSSASSLQCTNGGNILMLAQDTNYSGQLEITDSNIQTLVVCNGLNSPPTPYTPVGLVNPCGDNPGLHDEVFLKLQDGTLLASFSDNANGLNTRFSILNNNASYSTTDGDGCTFTLDSSGNIIYENHHY